MRRPFLPLLLAACGTAEPEQKARPAMWLVEDDDTRIYMLGTMHALPRGTDWDAGKVADAISAADELVMELSPAELAVAGGVFRKLAPRRSAACNQCAALGHRTRAVPRAGGDRRRFLAASVSTIGP